MQKIRNQLQESLYENKIIRRNLSSFTFVKVHLSRRSMPRVLVNGEVVRTEVLPRQRAHQDPPQGREGAAGNISIHFAGSHILRSSVSAHVLAACATSRMETRAIFARHDLFTLLAYDVIRVTGRKTRNGLRRYKGVL